MTITATRKQIIKIRVFGGGTSSAAPFVSGITALVKSLDPNIRADKLAKLITKSTVYVNGQELVNAYNALASIKLN